MKDRARTVKCPPPCGVVAHRLDTRPTTMPRLLRIRLYRCKADHMFETAETIVGKVRPYAREKSLVYKYSVKHGEKRRWAETDYSL